MGVSRVRSSTLFFLFLLALLIISRGFVLDAFVATDEARWFNRAANFYYAVGQREFGETFRNNSVAVFTMWITTAAFLIEFPAYRGQGQGYLHFQDPEWNSVFLKNGIDKLEVLVVSRQLMVAALIVLALLVFYYLKRLVGERPAFAAATLITLDPFYLALSRTSHLDAPMGTFLLLSLLAFEAYLRRKRRVDLYLSGVAGGLAFLSKLPGILVIPGIVGVAGLSWASAGGGRPDARRLAVWVKGAAAWALSFVVVVFALWPALWSDPVSTLGKTLSSPLNYIAEQDTRTSSDEPANIGVNRQGFTALVSDAARHAAEYGLSFLWRTTPVVLLGLVLGAAAFRERLGIFAEADARRLARLLLFTSLYFVLIMSVPYKAGEKYEKYIISSFLALDALAGMGWYAGLSWLTNKIGRAWQERAIVLGLTLLVLFQGAGLVDHFPYYFTYYNPLMGGSSRAGKTRFVGVGEGLAEAALYLNEMPDAENLKAFAWYGIGPFSYYFEGTTRIIPTAASYSENLRRNIREADYLVVYNNQWHRRIPAELFDILDEIEPVHRVWLNGIEYVRIYPTSAIEFK